MSKPRFRVIALNAHIVQIKLSPRITVIRNTHTDKDIAYFGFETLAQADVFTRWLSEHGVQHYTLSSDAGWCKPRQSKRVQSVSFEVKVHRAPRWLVERAVAKDLSRAS